MNFKKTCKSIVSFILGTGMMFSGSAFNNKSNAIFPEEFYMENLEKYKANHSMMYLLNVLKELQHNRLTLGTYLIKSKIPAANTSLEKAADSLMRAIRKCNIDKDKYVTTNEKAYVLLKKPGKVLEAAEELTKANKILGNATERAEKIRDALIALLSVLMVKAVSDYEEPILSLTCFHESILSLEDFLDLDQFHCVVTKAGVRIFGKHRFTPIELKVYAELMV